MKINKPDNHDDYTDHYETYEERKGKIRGPESDHLPKRPVRNWTKAWFQHVEDYDEHEEFFGKKNKNN